MKAGFIGVGQMGGPMAINLSSGFEVTAYYLNEQEREQFQNTSVIASDQMPVVASADVLFLCLPNEMVINEILFGNDKLFDDLTPGTIIVDTSTIDHEATLHLSDKLAQKNIHFVDAPISGMRARAEDGSLTMMCGGDETIVNKLRPMLSTMASNVIYMGDTGSGQLTKLINQLLFDINAAALAEILPLSVKLGLNPENIGKVVNSGTGKSYASEFFIPRILDDDFSQGYAMQSAYKDLVSASAISAKHQIPTPVLAAATATYQSALRAGLGEQDKGAMIRVFEELLDVKFRK